jgi:hypothetical protein
MDDPERYKLAAEKFQFLIHLWLQEDCGCRCAECDELLEEAERILEEPCLPVPHP